MAMPRQTPRPVAARLAPLLIALLSLSAFAAQAQTRQPPAGGPRPDASQSDPSRAGPPRGPKGPPTRELAELLGLDQKQSAALDTVLRERHEKMQALQQRAENERKATVAASDERVRKVLTPAQFETFKTWESQHRPPPPGGRHGRGGPGGPGGHGGPGGGHGGPGDGPDGPPPQD